MRSVLDKTSGNAPIKPTAMQKSAYAAHKDVLKVLLAIVISFLLILIWFGGVQGNTDHDRGGNGRYGRSCSWSILSQTNDCGGSGLPGDWHWREPYRVPASITLSAFVSTRYGGESATTADFLRTRDSGIAVQILFTVLTQSFITVGLHCAELETTLFRDEAMWREMTSLEGAILSELHSHKYFGVGHL